MNFKLLFKCFFFVGCFIPWIYLIYVDWKVTELKKAIKNMADTLKCITIGQQLLVSKLIRSGVLKGIDDEIDPNINKHKVN